MAPKKLILYFLTIFFSLNIVFSAYPNPELISTPSSITDSSIILNGYLGTSSKIEINGYEIQNNLVYGDSTAKSFILDGDLSNEVFDISVGENFYFSHGASGGVVYELAIFDSNQDLVESYTLSSGVSPQYSLDSPGTYTIKDLNSQTSKSISVNYQTIQKEVVVDSSDLSDGANTLNIVTYYSEGSEIFESSFDFEKYENDIVFDSDNFTSRSSVTGQIRVDSTSYNYYYIINDEGFQASCGTYINNQINLDSTSQEITISKLQEGINSVRIISTTTNCDRITGEYRFEVEVDRVAPDLDLIEAIIIQGSNQNGEYSPDVFDESSIYTNENRLDLIYDSDAIRVDYILNGRSFGYLVNEEKLDEFSEFTYSVDSDGNMLTLLLFPDNYPNSYIEYDYGRFHDKKVEIDDGVIEVKFNLDENYKDFNLTFYEEENGDNTQKTIRIYDLAFIEKGEVTSYFPRDEDNLFEINLNLDTGSNNITLIAYDIANNTKRIDKTIYFDDSDPELEGDTDPNSGDTLHFSIQNLKGTTSKPNVQVEVFVLPDDSYELDIDGDGDEERLTCANYETALIRNLDQLVYDYTRYAELDLNDFQLDLTIGSWFSKQRTTSDEKGDFEVYMGLLGESFDSGDLEEDYSQDSVSTRNEICIVMLDEYGNLNVDSFNLNYDPGNTVWREAEITTLPNSIYSAEIEQALTSDSVSGSDEVQFSMIARFKYEGGSEIKEIDNVNIYFDNSVSEDPFQGNGNILSSGMNWRYDKDINELLVYVPIEVSPLGEDPLDYPDEIQFNFAMRITYELEDSDIVIDTQNPVYFETKINIERPLDHTKWLTPSAISSGLGFLNKTMKFTEKAQNVMRVGSILSVGWCTVAKFTHTACLSEMIGADEDERKEIKAKCDQDFYNVCDRIAGLPSPNSCEGSVGESDTSFGLNGNSEITSGTYKASDFDGNLEFKSDDKLVGKWESVTIRTDSSNCASDEVEVTGRIVKYTDETNTFSSIATVETQADVRSTCVKAEKNGNKVMGVNLNEAANLCYTEGAPRFDNTKCSLSLYGIQDPGKGTPGKDPSTSIFSSIQCGAVVDTYSHLKVAYRVQEGIKSCLEQAKIGTIKGGYCERLIGQAVCDLATNVILPEVMQSGSASIQKGEQERGDGTNPATYARIMSNSNQEYDKRYAGSVAGQTQLSTDQIINKACLGAITGDWSVLEENILTAIESNEVEPVFGPPIAESRLQGYNPLTGEITIRYMFTYAAISGGQSIDTKVQLVCNPTAPNNEFCPSQRIVYSEDDGLDFKSRTFYVAADQSVNENKIITEDENIYWYNQIELTHVYEMGDDTKTVKEVFNIAHKSEMFAKCYWSAEAVILAATSDLTGGIECGTIFTDDSVLSAFNIVESKTSLMPQNQNTFYPGNSIYLDLGLTAQGDIEDGVEDLALVHYAACKTNGDGTYILGQNSGSAPFVTTLENVNEETTSAQLPVLIKDELEQVGSANNDYIIKFTKSNSQDQVAFIGTNGVVSGTSYFKKITVNNNNVDISTIGSASLVVQNLNLNNGNNNLAYNVLDFSGVEDGEIIITFDGQPENVQIQIGQKVSESSTTQFSGTAVLPRSSGELIAGTCTLNARVLPLSQANQITLDNFESYSPSSSSYDNEDLILDEELESIEIYKKTFQVKETPASVTNFFQILNIFENKVIGLDANDPSLSIEYIDQDSRNSDDIKAVISYDISIDGYGVIAKSRVDSSDFVSGSKVSEKEKNRYSMNVQFTDLETLKTALNSIEAQEGVNGLILSSASTLDAKLSYTVRYVTKKDNDNWYTEPSDNYPSKTGVIEFYVYSGDNSQPYEDRTRG